MPPLVPTPAPTWAERLAGGELENEISSQIPAGVTARTPVHFGIRFAKDPRGLDAGATLEKLKALIARCRALAPAEGLQDSDLTFITARQSSAEEESIFIDRESILSQTLLRQALTIITMSESDRTHVRLGGLGGLEAVEVEDRELHELIRDLKALKGAQKLEPGKYRVLFGPVLTGVLAHEAFGHSQEADTCARGRSKAWELYKSGEHVGNEHATILNNPAIYETGGKPFAAWGSYFFDEEGWLARSQVLLEQGVLRAPMTNLTSAIRLGVPRTANGKRESWANGVYTRQTNTYFSPGDRTLGQLMEDLGDGFLALHPAGGMEDPKGMGIQVGISYLQEVKAGQPTGRVFKGPAGGDIQLTGYTPDVLNSIVAKSKIEVDSSSPDTAKHPWNDAGGCGKYHKEFVFAGCGWSLHASGSGDSRMTIQKNLMASTTHWTMDQLKSALTSRPAVTAWDHHRRTRASARTLLHARRRRLQSPIRIAKSVRITCISSSSSTSRSRGAKVRSRRSSFRRSRLPSSSTRPSSPRAKPITRRGNFRPSFRKTCRRRKPPIPAWPKIWGAVMEQVTDAVGKAVATRRDSRFNSAELFLSVHDSELHLSNGLVHRSSQSRIYMEAAYSYARAGESGKIESDEYLNTRWAVTLDELPIEKIFSETSDRARHSLDTAKPKTGRYPRHHRRRRARNPFPESALAAFLGQLLSRPAVRQAGG